MKIVNVKILSALFLTTVSLSAMADQQVVQDLGTFGKWKAAKIRDHALLHKDACIAYTVSVEKGGSSLELFAPELKNSQTEVYAEPTVMVVARGVPAFVRGILVDQDGQNAIHLTLATNAEGSFGLLAREADRKAILDLLRRANSASVQLVNEKNKVIKVLTFSLAGSTKGTDAILNGCALKFE